PGAGRWWIVTGNASGNGPWSSPTDFTIAGTPPPGQATLIAPAGATASSTPTFTWNAVAGATQSLVWTDVSSDGRMRTWYSAAQTNCASGSGHSSPTPRATLHPGAGRWWIVTANASGNGPWSSPTDFTVAGTPPPGQATLIAPNGATGTNTPTFTWNAVA